jgi:hypothetical protein
MSDNSGRERFDELQVKINEITRQQCHAVGHTWTLHMTHSVQDILIMGLHDRVVTCDHCKANGISQVTAYEVKFDKSTHEFKPVDSDSTG